jgi:N-acyl-D-amino-acid deacylase
MRGIRIFNSGNPHPRGYGTNARVLSKYVRDEKVISLEEAIRRMTSLPAQKFQLQNRGILREGFAADIVVFDERKYRIFLPMINRTSTPPVLNMCW